MLKKKQYLQPVCWTIHTKRAQNNSLQSLHHYGREVVDHTRIGLYFADDEPEHAFRPHMHLRGKHMRFKVIYPDNSSEELINVPNYNFAWQPTYRLTEPKTLPAGSRVVINGAFDNWEYNPGVPDSETVNYGGPQTWEEMFIGYFLIPI